MEVSKYCYISSSVYLSCNRKVYEIRKEVSLGIKKANLVGHEIVLRAIRGPAYLHTAALSRRAIGVTSPKTILAYFVDGVNGGRKRRLVIYICLGSDLALYKWQLSVSGLFVAFSVSKTVRLAKRSSQLCRARNSASTILPR